MIFSRTEEPFVLGKYSAVEAEKLRLLRANFLHAASEDGRDARSVLVVSDCNSSDMAKATLKLACSLVAEQERVIVLELNRKTPCLGDVLDLGGKTLNDHLEGKASADELGDFPFHGHSEEMGKGNDARSQLCGVEGEDKLLLLSLQVSLTALQ